MAIVPGTFMTVLSCPYVFCTSWGVPVCLPPSCYHDSTTGPALVYLRALPGPGLTSPHAHGRSLSPASFFCICLSIYFDSISDFCINLLHWSWCFLLPSFRPLPFSVKVFDPLFQRAFLTIALSVTPRPHYHVCGNL